jgi:hypothetical protein
MFSIESKANAIAELKSQNITKIFKSGMKLVGENQIEIGMQPLEEELCLTTKTGINKFLLRIDIGSFDSKAHAVLTPYIALFSLANGELSEASSIIGNFIPKGENMITVRVDINTLPEYRSLGFATSLLTLGHNCITKAFELELFKGKEITIEGIDITEKYPENPNERGFSSFIAQQLNYTLEDEITKNHPIWHFTFTE